MKKPKIILLAVFIAAAGSARAEFNGELAVSSFKGIDRTSLGFNGMLFPQSLNYGRLSLGLDFGLEMIERHLTDYSPFRIDSLVYPQETFYFKSFNKEYRDFMFFPVGATLRFEFGDWEEINSFRPAIFLGFGGIFNIYQKSKRKISYRYNSLHTLQNDPNNELWEIRYTNDFGGETIGSFDFYLKPKVALYWHRFYLSYEYHFFPKYLRGSGSFGYIFRL